MYRQLSACHFNFSKLYVVINSSASPWFTKKLPFEVFSNRVKLGRDPARFPAFFVLMFVLVLKTLLCTYFMIYFNITTTVVVPKAKNILVQRVTMADFPKRFMILKICDTILSKIHYSSFCSPVIT
jgi:hypothetical protein